MMPLSDKTGSRYAAGKRIDGFTLVEVLVSSVVLALLVSLVAAMTNSALITTARSHRRMDTDEQARMVMERIGLDFKRMVLRGDVDYQFNKAAGNDTFYFYANTAGYAGDRGLAVTGYRINAAGKLERGVRGLFWNGAVGSSKLMAFSATTPTLKSSNTLDALLPQDAGAGNKSDYQVLSDNIFRLEISFLLKGSQSTNPVVDPAMIDPTAGPSTLQIKSVAAVIVTVAALDNAGQAMITDFTSLQGGLPDATEGTDTSTRWNALVSQPGFAASIHTSPAALAGLHVYQRSFYLDQ